MFRQIAKKIIVAIIRFEAKIVLKKYRPKIIGITGSVGKTGTKDAVAQVLASRFSVRKSPKSFNSEFGVPLTILNCDNAWYNLGGWIRNILEGFSLIVFRTEYPEWLVLEVGADRPGDIRDTVSYVPFDLVIITRLPEVLPHVEFFTSNEQLVAEKLLLARAVKSSGTVLLNFDDPKIMAVAGELQAQMVTYGWGNSASVRGSSETIMYQEAEGGVKIPDGLSLRVDYQGSTMPFRLRGIYAHHQLYGILAAISAGLTLGLNMVEIGTALESLEATPGRFKLLPGIKDSLVIDDSYNSSPAALDSALDTLDKFECAGRKIAILGDMLELGSHTAEAHRAAGAHAAKVCDNLITVGIRAKFISEEAEHKKMSKKKMLHFATAEEAAEAARELIKPHDLVLVKGSQGVRLEKVVEAIMAQPELKNKLLVRQEPEWHKIKASA